VMVVDASRPNEQRSCIERDPHTTVVIDLYNAASILHHGQKSCQKSNVWSCDAPRPGKLKRWPEGFRPSLLLISSLQTDSGVV
jgi:hypothetical protein